MSEIYDTIEISTLMQLREGFLNSPNNPLKPIPVNRYIDAHVFEEMIGRLQTFPKQTNIILSYIDKLKKQIDYVKNGVVSLTGIERINGIPVNLWDDENLIKRKLSSLSIGDKSLYDLADAIESGNKDMERTIRIQYAGNPNGKILTANDRKTLDKYYYDALDNVSYYIHNSFFIDDLMIIFFPTGCDKEVCEELGKFHSTNLKMKDELFHRLCTESAMYMSNYIKHYSEL